MAPALVQQTNFGSAGSGFGSVSATLDSTEFTDAGGLGGVQLVRAEEAGEHAPRGKVQIHLLRLISFSSPIHNDHLMPGF